MLPRHDARNPEPAAENSAAMSKLNCASAADKSGSAGGKWKFGYRSTQRSFVAYHHDRCNICRLRFEFAAGSRRPRRMAVVDAASAAKTERETRPSAFRRFLFLRSS
jgi:hypothetical protein